MFWELTTVSMGSLRAAHGEMVNVQLVNRLTMFTIDLLKHVRFFPLEMRLQLGSFGSAEVGMFSLLKRSIIENKTLRRLPAYLS